MGFPLIEQRVDVVLAHAFAGFCGLEPGPVVTIGGMGEFSAMSQTRRVNRRYSLASVDALVEGTICKVLNVSADGILIDGWKNPPPSGTTGAFTVRAPVADKVESIEITGTVIRVQDDGAVALTFPSPRRDWLKILVFLDKKEREGAN